MPFIGRSLIIIISLVSEAIMEAIGIVLITMAFNVIFSRRPTDEMRRIDDSTVI